MSENGNDIVTTSVCPDNFPVLRTTCHTRIECTLASSPVHTPRAPSNLGAPDAAPRRPRARAAPATPQATDDPVPAPHNRDEEDGGGSD